RYAPAGGVVVDGETQLVWEQESSLGTVAWADAKAYCASLTLAGLAWRLPTEKELLTLVDPTQQYPSMDPTAFPTARSAEYWSITTRAWSGSPGPWVVDFKGYGSADQIQAQPPAYVRCVH